MLIDWLACTFKGANVLVLKELKRFFIEWKDLNTGGMGYDKSALVWETGRVFWSTTRPDMGIHVVLPASAFKASGSDPQCVLVDLHDLGGEFTRLDLAADDMSGQLSMETIRQNVKDRDFVSRCRQVVQIEALVGHGHTIYFGKRGSETMVRIYDKAAEQRAQGANFMAHWIRAELELKHERAHAAAEFIVKNLETWRDTARGWFLQFLDFKERGDDENKSRWQTCAWWSEFLEKASKVRIVIQRVVKTVEDVKNWIEKQVAPSLFVLASTIGHDEIFEMVGNACTRLSEKHEDMISSYAQMLGAMSSA